MKAHFQVTYFLWTARKNKDGTSPVYIRSQQNTNERMIYNTGLKLREDQWNFGTAKKPRNEPKNKPAKLIDLERKLQDTYSDLLSQGEKPNLDQLIEHLDDVKKPTNKSIVAWCDDYERGKYSEGRKKAVRTIKSNVEGFNKGLTFDQLTKPRIKAFFEHLSEKGVANNSQYKRLRALVNVANHADIECPHLSNYKLPYETKNALKARLTWSEVKAVIDEPATTTLEQVAKDTFLLACFTGLRISDLQNLHSGELHEYYYERIQIKTGQPVYVTVHKYNADLLRKYIDTGISYSRQKLSKALKEVLKRSGLDKKSITKVQAVGYERKETAKEKWEEIAFHSGRRFYARLLNDLSLGGEIARDELGHGFKTITDLYAGSPDHTYRVARVRKAMESMEETLKELALMKVA